MQVEPFYVPNEVIIDPISGYSVNIPLGLQVPPNWVEENPLHYARILQIRKDRNIKVENDMLPSKEHATVEEGEYTRSKRTPAPIPKKRPKKKSA